MVADGALGLGGETCQDDNARQSYMCNYSSLHQCSRTVLSGLRTEEQEPGIDGRDHWEEDLERRTKDEKSREETSRQTVTKTKFPVP